MSMFIWVTLGGAIGWFIGYRDGRADEREGKK